MLRKFLANFTAPILQPAVWFWLSLVWFYDFEFRI